MSMPQRKDLCDRAAVLAHEDPNLEYVAAATRVGQHFGVFLHQIEHPSLKNNISRRLAALGGLDNVVPAGSKENLEDGSRTRSRLVTSPAAATGSGDVGVSALRTSMSLLIE